MRRFYLEDDRVKVDDAGRHFLGTVIRHEPNDKVWIKLDIGDNPLLYHVDELEPV